MRNAEIYYGNRDVDRLPFSTWEEAKEYAAAQAKIKGTYIRGMSWIDKEAAV